MEPWWKSKVLYFWPIVYGDRVHCLAVDARGGPIVYDQNLAQMPVFTLQQTSGPIRLEVKDIRRLFLASSQFHFENENRARQ